MYNTCILDIYREKSNAYQPYSQTENLNTLGDVKANQHTVTADVEAVCVLFFMCKRGDWERYQIPPSSKASGSYSLAVRRGHELLVSIYEVMATRDLRIREYLLAKER